MKNTFNKFILGAATLGTVIAPVAIAISCGSLSSADLLLGVRKDELDQWRTIANKFEAATGKTVELVSVGNMKSEYGNWAGSNSIPDVTITDGGARAEGVKEKWFQQLDLADIFSNDDYKVMDSQVAMDPEDSNQFNIAMMNTAKVDKNPNSNMYDVYPSNVGPSALYYLSNQLVTSNKIHTYIVDSTESDANKRVKKLTDVSGSEISGDTNLTCSIDDITAYMSHSVYDAYKPTSAQLDISSGKTFYSIGQAGLNQRIFSIAKSCFKGTTDNTKLKAVMLANADVSFGQMLDGDITTNGYSPYVGSDKVTLQDKEVYQIGNVSGKWSMGMDVTESKDGPKVTKLTAENLKNNTYMMKPYYSHLGYFNGLKNHNMASSDAAEVKDNQTAFASGHFNLMKGALWMKNSIEDKIKANGSDEKNLGAIPLPMGSAGWDSYAIAQSAKGETATLAKKFIRFIATPEINALVAGSKTISNNIKGQKIQIGKYKDDKVFAAFLEMGSVVSNHSDSDPDLIKDVQGIYNGESDFGINYEWYQSTFKDKKNVDESKGNAVTINNYLDQINKGNQKYWEDTSIASANGAWKKSNVIYSVKHPASQK